MKWHCPTCGIEHDDLPRCLGVGAPWQIMDIPETEFERRVQLTSDICIVDGREFFIRGHIVIPIHGESDPLLLSVWSSLSRKSFDHMCSRWHDGDRDGDPPYFGWLSSHLPGYPDTRLLKLSVQSRRPGWVPIFTLEPTGHPLAVEQRNGISPGRWHELAAFIVHP